MICCRKRKKAAGQLNPQQKPGKHETDVDDSTRLALREWMVGMSHVIKLTRVTSMWTQPYPAPQRTMIMEPPTQQTFFHGYPPQHIPGYGQSGRGAFGVQQPQQVRGTPEIVSGKRQWRS